MLSKYDKSRWIGAFLIGITFTTRASEHLEEVPSPISKLQKENLIAAQQLGLISHDVLLAGLHEARHQASKRRLHRTSKLFPVGGKCCSLCSLRLKIHYGGEAKGERWCELNEALVKAPISGTSPELIAAWRAEQSSIESGSEKVEE